MHNLYAYMCLSYVNNDIVTRRIDVLFSPTLVWRSHGLERGGSRPPLLACKSQSLWGRSVCWALWSSLCLPTWGREGEMWWGETSKCIIDTTLRCAGTVCCLCLCSSVIPVAVCVWAMEYILSMFIMGWYFFSLCRGNTTLVKALVILLHSRITPGSGCSGHSFWRTSCQHHFDSLVIIQS